MGMGKAVQKVEMEYESLGKKLKKVENLKKWQWKKK